MPTGQATPAAIMALVVARVGTVATARFPPVKVIVQMVGHPEEAPS